MDTNKRNLRRVLPVDRIGSLKDMAMEVIRRSSRLEGGLAPETAKGLSRELRLLNSYHSNLIEGHKTFIVSNGPQTTRGDTHKSCVQRTRWSRKR